MKISYPDKIPGILRRSQFGIIEHSVWLTKAEIIYHYESIGLEYGPDYRINGTSLLGDTDLMPGPIMINFYNDDAFIMAKLVGDTEEIGISDEY